MALPLAPDFYVWLAFLLQGSIHMDLHRLATYFPNSFCAKIMVNIGANLKMEFYEFKYQEFTNLR